MHGKIGGNETKVASRRRCEWDYCRVYVKRGISWRFLEIRTFSCRAFQRITVHLSYTRVPSVLYMYKRVDVMGTSWGRGRKFVVPRYYRVWENSRATTVKADLYSSHLLIAFYTSHCFKYNCKYKAITAAYYRSNFAMKVYVRCIGFEMFLIFIILI